MKGRMYAIKVDWSIALGDGNSLVECKVLPAARLFEAAKISEYVVIQRLW